MSFKRRLLNNILISVIVYFIILIIIIVLSCYQNFYVKEKLRLIPQSTGDALLDAAIMAGPGNVKRKTAEQSSLVQWQVTNILNTFQGLNSFLYSSDIQDVS